MGVGLIMERDQFINNLLRSSSSTESPDSCIRHMIENLGEGFEADRAYIFELDGEGNFNNTYDWSKPGVRPFKNVLSKIPYEDVLDSWYRDIFFGGYICIEDMEAYKEVNSLVYDILKPQDVKTLLVWPMFLGEKCIGFIGVDNPPLHRLEEIKYIFRLVSYFMSIMTRYRDSMNQLERISYEDQLTGVMNRHALESFHAKHNNSLKMIGIISCDINGLKVTNDTKGHEAGDKLITDTAESLSIVFGNKNVYRMGGDEFIVIYTSGPERHFNVKIAQAVKLMEYKGVKTAIGYIFKEETDKSIFELIKEVDGKMYEDKAKFYADGRNERRNRR